MSNINRTKVESLISEHGLTIPINVRELAEKLSITISEDFNSDKIDNNVSGEIDFSDGHGKVWINPTQSPVRKRFTIAHEIGHYFNDANEGNIVDYDSTVMRRDGNWDVKEYNANKFAAELLMPYELLKAEGTKRIKDLIDNKQKIKFDDFISELANKFNVSFDAMKYRLKNTGLFKSN